MMKDRKKNGSPVRLPRTTFFLICSSPSSSESTTDGGDSRSSINLIGKAIALEEIRVSDQISSMVSLGCLSKYSLMSSFEFPFTIKFRPRSGPKWWLTKLLPLL